MKPISISQWNMMNAKKRSWLVCRVLGKRASVYWSLYHPDGGTMGGSYDSRRFAFDLVDEAQSMIGKYLNTPRRKWREVFPNHTHETVLRFSLCVVRPSVAYPSYAEYDHLAIALINELLVAGQTVTLKHYKEANVFMVGDSVRSSLGQSLAAAACLTFLKAKGMILEPPSAPSASSSPSA